MRGLSQADQERGEALLAKTPLLPVRSGISGSEMKCADDAQETTQPNYANDRHEATMAERKSVEAVDETVDHRSTSPNTMSIALSTAVVSASMWPFIMKSIACRCEKPVGRILQR